MCDLCKAEKQTDWLYEDEICYVCVCRSCHRFMIVLRRHTMYPSLTELQHLDKITKLFFPKGQQAWRGYQRKIKDHWHEHILEGDDRVVMLGRECVECGYIGLASEDSMCPECDGYMLLVDLDEDPLTRLRTVQCVVRRDRKCANQNIKF